MRKGENVLAMGQALQKEMNNIGGEIPVGVDVGTISYQPAVVEESVSECLRDHSSRALIIVLVVSFL